MTIRFRSRRNCPVSGTRMREWFLAPAILLALVAVLRTLAFLFHDAELLMNMIIPEVVIASLLILASKTLVEPE